MTAPERQGPPPIHELRAPLSRRFAAAAADLAFLWLVAELLAAFYEAEFIALGTNGRWIGALFFLAYIGGQNSTLTQGQTFGKRCFGLRVVGNNGKPIGLERSLLRAALLLLPWLARGVFPFPDSAAVAFVLHTLAAAASIGYGGILLGSYALARHDGRALHDRLLGTVVVRNPTEELPRLTSSPLSLRWRLAATLWLALSLTTSVFQWWFWGGSGWSQVVAMHTRVRQLEDLTRAEVFWGSFHLRDLASRKRTVRYLEVRAMFGQKIDDYNDRALRVAAALFAGGLPPDIDAVRITVGYEFDLLLARRRWSRSYVRSPEEWHDLLLAGQSQQARGVGASPVRLSSYTRP